MGSLRASRRLLLDLRDGKGRSLSAWALELEAPATVEEWSGTAAVHHGGGVDVDCRLAAGAPNQARLEALAAAFPGEAEGGRAFLSCFDELFPPPGSGLDAVLEGDRRWALQLLLPRGSRERRDILRAWAREAAPLRSDPAGHPWEALRRMRAAAGHGIPPASLPDADALRRCVSWRLKEVLARPAEGALVEAEALFDAAAAAGLHLPLWELRWLAWLALSKWPAGRRPARLERLAGRLRLQEPRQDVMKVRERP